VPYEVTTTALLAACALVLLLLLGYNVRRGHFPRAAWRWLGVFGLLLAVQVGLEIFRQIAWLGGLASLVEVR